MTGVVGCVGAIQVVGVTLSPSPCSGSGTSPVISDACVATPDNTVGNTYAWTQVSGPAVTITAPSAASTTFSAVMSAGTSLSAVMRCTVTDSVTGMSGYADVQLDLEEVN